MTLLMLRLCSAKRKITFQHHNSSNTHINKNDQEKKEQRPYKTKLPLNISTVNSSVFSKPLRPAGRRACSTLLREHSRMNRAPFSLTFLNLLLADQPVT